MSGMENTLRFAQENNLSVITIGYREKNGKEFQKRFPPEDTGKLLEANPDIVEFIEGNCNPKLQTFVTNRGVV